MIPWLNVKGAWKQPSSIWGKANSVWQSLGDMNSEPYNEALKLVGFDKVDGLSVILTDSSMCEALAGNAEAYGIMKENYSADMTSAIDSNWNEGLNLLNYRCKLKCFLYHHGNQCSNISGGWVTWTSGEAGGRTPTLGGEYIYFHLNAGEKNTYQEGGAIAKNKVDLSGYNTLRLEATSSNSGGGWTAPGYTMGTGFKDTYETKFYGGTWLYTINMDNTKLYPSRTVFTGNISSKSSGYPVLGITQGAASNNYMYHRWHSIAILP